MSVDYEGWLPTHPFMYLLDTARWWETDEDWTNPLIAYIGFVDKKGNWMIMKEVSDGLGIYSYRIATGRSGYVAAWVGRAGLTYRYPYQEI